MYLFEYLMTAAVHLFHFTGYRLHIAQKFLHHLIDAVESLNGTLCTFHLILRNGSCSKNFVHCIGGVGRNLLNHLVNLCSSTS